MRQPSGAGSPSGNAGSSLGLASEARGFATNFFQQQAQARRNTWRIFALFWIAIAATVIITTVVIAFFLSHSEEFASKSQVHQGQFVLHPEVLMWSTLGTLLVVGFGYFRRRWMLAKGGKAVATSLGGRLVERRSEQGDERRLLNVVDEMALAARIPSPPVYLLDNENSINAFAAGYHPTDAVVGVTRGSIQRLNRDELQGLMAHEFSHIFNGDMRLNMQMVCWIGGLEAISTFGRSLMRSASKRSSSSRKNNNGGGVILGLALFVVGIVGTLLASLLRAAISRQREHLADASALQFTRNPYGIGGVLWKIWKLKDGGLNSPYAKEVSHFFLSSASGAGAASYFDFGFFNTHPALETRLQRICPELLRDGTLPPGLERDFFERVDAPIEKRIEIPLPQTAKLAGAVGLLRQATAQASALGASLEGTPVGGLGASLLRFAFREAALAKSLALAVANIRPTSISPTDTELRQQLDAWLATVDQPELERLQILNLSLPALRETPEDERRTWLSELEQLQLPDDTSEARFSMLLIAYLIFALHPDRRTPLRAPMQPELLLATHQLLSFAAQVGHDAAHEREQAYVAGWMSMKRKLPGLAAQPLTQLRSAQLVHAFRVLKATPPLTLAEIHQSLDRVLGFDRRLKGAEAALVQALRTASGAPNWPR